MSEGDSTGHVIRIDADSPVAAVRQPAPVAVTPPATGTLAMAGRPVAAVAGVGGDETGELREDIEETRTELSETLNAIQEKLNPRRLMEQAKDTVQDTTDHVIAQATHAAHDAVTGAVDHTKEAVHDATIGKVEHMVSNVTDAAKNLVGSATGTANQSTATSHDMGARRITGGDDTSATGQPGQPGPGVGASLWGTIKENPIPTALAAASLGWLFAHRSTSAAASRTPHASYQQQSPQGQDTVRVTGDTAQDKAGQMAAQVGSAVGDTAGTIQDKAGQVANQVGSTAGHIGSTVGSTVGQVGGAVGGTVGQVGNTVGSTVGQVGGAVGGAVGGTVGQVGSAVGSTVGGLAEGTQQQARRAQNQFQRMLHENPLAVGAAGLALGAAVGLAIPESQRESRVMGGPRDALVDRAIGTAQDTMQKVGTIARKAESAAEGAVKDEAHAQGLTS